MFSKRKKKIKKSPNQSASLLPAQEQLKAHACLRIQTVETLRLIEKGAGLHLILAIKTSGQIMVVNLLFLPLLSFFFLKSPKDLSEMD